MKTLSLIPLTLLLALLLCGQVEAQQIPYSHGDPTALEQYMLELINYARMNPPAEGVYLADLSQSNGTAWYGTFGETYLPSDASNLLTQFASYPAVPPLAFNPILIRTARAHSLDEFTNHYSAYDSLNGETPDQRMSIAGYSVPGDENCNDLGAKNAENTLEGEYDFLVDFGIPDLGRRYASLNYFETEVGIGIVGALYGGQTTQDFGNAGGAFLLGVAYNDPLGGFYQPGEGLSNVTVTPNYGEYYAVTSTSGGYAIPLMPTQTNTTNLNVPVPCASTPWSNIQAYDEQFQAEQISNAPSVAVALSWSGGNLPSPMTTYVTIKQSIVINYTITGTDGAAYHLTMNTAQHVKADLMTTLKPQKVTVFSKIKDKTYGDAPFPLEATATNGLPIAYSVVNGPATISSNTVTLTGAGSVEIAASQPGNTNYLTSSPFIRNFIVKKAHQEIEKFTRIPETIIVAAPFTISVPSSTSGLPVTLSIESGPATISGNTVTLTGKKGVVVVEASCAGDPNFLPARDITTRFTVKKPLVLPPI